jgi:hypothetical protein
LQGLAIAACFHGHPRSDAIPVGVAAAQGDAQPVMTERLIVAQQVRRARRRRSPDPG